MIRVVLPAHLRALARLSGEVALEVPEGGTDAGAATLSQVLDVLEAQYPVLRGTIRFHGGGRRRDLVRFFACEQDISHEPPDVPLPQAVLSGTEPLLIVGAMAGG